MTIAGIVPIKHLSNAKSRLAGHLTSAQRSRLVIEVARQVIEAIAASHLVEPIAVATPQRLLAMELGTAWIPDEGSLNRTLESGLRWADAIGAQAALIVPADLPYLEPADIRVCIERLPAGGGVVLARTDDGGTGALLIAPPTALVPRFGKGSGERHAHLALASGLHLREVASRGLRLDLDTFEEFKNWERNKNKEGHTHGKAPADVSLEAGS